MSFDEYEKCYNDMGDVVLSEGKKNVNGFFYKESSQQQLGKGITAIFEGEFWLSRRILAQYLERTRSKPRKISHNANLLPRREKQILNLTATGATNTEIAVSRIFVIVCLDTVRLDDDKLCQRHAQPGT